jgi:NAD(P)-dependent dehydrogenase (short-subunit alcohol dehydrogenase family)
VSFDGKTVLVTGAASGIGKAMVEQFRARGASVVGVDIDQSRLDIVSAELPDVSWLRADIATSAGAEQAIAAADGSLHVLCNNAGVLDRLAPVTEISEAEWDRVIAVNLTAPFLMTRRAIPIMLAQQFGVIVNTGSVASLRGGRGGAAYTASKTGLAGLTRNVGVSYGEYGIRCNLIASGGVATGLADGVTPSGTRSERGTEVLNRYDPRPPRAEPDAIANIAVFLASDEGARINAAMIPADGGWTAG